MPRTIFVPITGGAPSGARRRRYLSREAKQEALDALAAEKRRVHGKDDAPATPELQKIYGAKISASWDMLRHCIDRSWRWGSKTWPKANILAASLIKKTFDEDLLKKVVEDITSLDCPDGEVGARGEPRRDQPQVSHPETVSDFRAILVGQLPRADLHPVVMVKPDDGRDYWYPQYGGKHNPVVAGSAFACLALFGDPDVRGSRKPDDDDVQDFLVHVYALAAPWDGGSERFKDKELARRLKPCRPEYIAAFTIQREVAPANSVTIGDKDGVRWRDSESKEIIECKAPVTISWVGTVATIEVREAEGDHFLKNRYGISPVILDIVTGKHVGPATKHHVPLKKAGLYRVRLHARKPAFVSPLFEWWLNITNTVEQRASIPRHEKQAGVVVPRPGTQAQDSRQGPGVQTG